MNAKWGLQKDIVVRVLLLRRFAASRFGDAFKFPVASATPTCGLDFRIAIRQGSAARRPRPRHSVN